MVNIKILKYLLNLYDACGKDYKRYILRVSELIKGGELKKEDIPKSLLKAIGTLNDEKTSRTV